MKLYNTLTKKTETVEPIQKSKLGLYACGPTVYDFSHLGHLRKYTMDDVLVRSLRHSSLGNFEVKFVQNITDVGHLSDDGDSGEDKLEKGAKKYNKTVWEIAAEFEEYFWKSMDAMGNLWPDISCKATDHIPEQLAMVQQLEKKGFTYVIDGDGVYFDTSKFPDYGKMAQLNLEQQQEGVSLAAVAGKRNSSDFVLWKFERPGENRAMVWPSPWAERSFPGWHIECSAMGCHYLGEQIDIHTGGIDHIPVHHTNEIAQAEAAYGKSPFVKYWVHHNFLQIEGEKMSKSLENFFTIDDVLERGFDPMVLRMLFLTSHYRSEMNFTWENLTGISKAYKKLVRQVKDLYEHEAEDLLDGDSDSSQAQAAPINSYREKFFASMANDLNTAEALAVVWEVMKDAQLTMESKIQLISSFDVVLGLQLLEHARDLIDSEIQQEDQELPATVAVLVGKRAQARQDKNWPLADELRDKLEEMDYEVIDGGNGQEVKKTQF